MRFKQFLIEKETEKKKIVFKETDGLSPFPPNTVSALEKEISSQARDLDLEWKSAAELVDAAFENLEVPKPDATNKNRWVQYVDMLKHAIKELYKSRGLSSGWSKVVS